jgi:predicted amidohydrolase
MRCRYFKGAPAAVTAPGALPAEQARRMIDASGCIVIPGGIDPHVHLRHLDQA